VILACLSDDNAAVAREATQLANKINKNKLYQHAIGILTGKPCDKFVYAIRALGYIDKLTDASDDDSFHILAQFMDHKDLELRYEAIWSLDKLLTRLRFILNRQRRQDELKNLRDILAVVPHVLKDRIKLGKDSTKLLAASLKCLTSLWLVFDKGLSDTGKWDIAHILVKGHLSTSLIVGGFDSIFAFIGKAARHEDVDMRCAAWECLKSTDLFGTADINTEPVEELL
jgi:hypothetical protein